MNDDILRENLDTLQKNRVLVLMNSANEYQKKLKEDPTNIQVQKALEKVMSQLEKLNPAKEIEKKDRVFENAIEVLNYLSEKGFQAHKSKFYRDLNKDLIKRNEDGTFPQDAVDEYARTLKPKKERAGGNLASHQKDIKRKLDAEIRLKEAQAKTAEHKLEILEGKFVLKTDVWLELAARAVAFRNSLKNEYESRILEMIGIVEGDTSRSEDLLQWLCGVIDYSLSEYAKPLDITLDVTKALEDFDGKTD